MTRIEDPIPDTVDRPPLPADRSHASTNGTTNGNGSSITHLVTGIIDDAKVLARQQLEMFKSELREDFDRSKRAAAYGSIGIVLLTVGALGLITALVYVLHEKAGLDMWVSWGIIGGLFLIAGGVFAYLGNELLKSFNPLPDKTFTAIKENITWTDTK